MNKIMVFLITGSLSIMLVPAAHAETWCDGSSECVTLAPTDKLTERVYPVQALYQKVGTGGRYGRNPGELGCTTVWPTKQDFDTLGQDRSCYLAWAEVRQREYQRFHPYRDNAAYIDATKQFFHYPDGTELPYNADGLADDVRILVEYNTPRCPITVDGKLTYEGSPNPLLPLTDTALIQAVCGSPATVQPTAVAPQTAQPVTAATCAPITVTRHRVTIAATGVACAPARNLLARYMRTGNEPAGYVCVTAKSGRSRAATCASTARAKSSKRIVGRWRV